MRGGVCRSLIGTEPYVIIVKLLNGPKNVMDKKIVFKPVFYA